MYQARGTVDVGSKAPEFKARDAQGRVIDMASFRGKSSLVLFFYRNSRCRTCRGELADLADQYPSISGQGGEVIALSTDGPDEAKDLAVDLRLPFPVISDPDARIIRLYGIFDAAVDTAFPAIFLVDRQGAVQFMKKIEGLDDLIPAEEVVRRLNNITAG